MLTINKVKNIKPFILKRVIPLAAIATVFCILPELASAADTVVNDAAFTTALNKITAWTNGGAGKLITFIAIVGTCVMGVFGFSGKAIMGALGVGILLSTAKTIVDMIFGA